MECSFWGVWDSVGNAEKWLALFFLLEEIGLESTCQLYGIRFRQFNVVSLAGT